MTVSGSALAADQRRTIKPLLPFAEALATARSVRLHESNVEQERRAAVLVPPTCRHGTAYGAAGCPHGLGTGGQAGGATTPLPFSEALAFARALRLRNRDEWIEWCSGGSRPPNVPASPAQAYAGRGWQVYVHWLGAWNTAAGSSSGGGGGFLPFPEALVVARSLGLKS